MQIGKLSYHKECWNVLVLHCFSKVNGGLATAWGINSFFIGFILFYVHDLLLLYLWLAIMRFDHNHGTHFNLKHSEFTFGCLLNNHKKLWFLVFFSMYIDRYCATESLSSLVKQHIPGATLLQQNDQQLVYSLPFKDMDKFSGITYFQFLGCWIRILHWE